VGEQQRCIRDERATREKYNLIGNDKALSQSIGVSRCGETISNQWFFMDADHALHSMRPMGGVAVCPKCLKVIVEICLEELGKIPRDWSKR
jgi:hypothetical protein